MTDEERLQEFVNDVYLTRFNRFIDDITDEEGIVEVQKTVRFANMFCDELENETDWNFSRVPDQSLGTIATVDQVFDLPAGVLRLVTNTERPLILKQGDSIVSRFEVVDANQITQRSTYYPGDRVASVGGSLVFSREFTDYEIGATVEADVINSLPRLSADPVSITLLDTVKPYSLLVLGVAKNATLPDIVQGGLSPSFVQKYGDLLENAIVENDKSSTADEAIYDDYGYIGGVGF